MHAALQHFDNECHYVVKCEDRDPDYNNIQSIIHISVILIMIIAYHGIPDSLTQHLFGVAVQLYT